MKIFLIFFILASLVYNIFITFRVRKINKNIDKQNNELLSTNINLTSVNQALKNEQESLIKQIHTAKEAYAQIEETQEELSRKAFENFFNELDKDYQKVSDEYEKNKEKLEFDYAEMQQTLALEIDSIKADLTKLKETRAAAIQASIREEEIRDKISFYCISLKDTEINDITKLEQIKPSLTNPRILSMLIWSTYFQKPLKALANNVLGTTDAVCGIYKITNQLNGKCYIGQAVDVAKRWAEHIKCGLGIDTPTGNKLYRAMKEYGVQNFSFELLEKCPREQLNEKERFYIQLYQANDFGYNILKGNN